MGFIKNNRNLNYYDDGQLENCIKDFVVECLERQLKFGFDHGLAFCLGEGKNFRYLSQLNKDLELFEKIIPLAHPRFIMQYKLKKKTEYVEQYLRELAMVNR